MKKCKSCDLSFSTNRKTCPFCMETLTITQEEGFVHRYPNYVPPSYKSNFLYRLFVFLSVSGIIISAMVNYFTYQSGDRLWSLYVLATIVYLWFLVRKTILSKVNIARRFVYQTIVLTLVAYLIDVLSLSTGWSLNYLFPFLTIATTLTIVMLSMIKKIRFSEDIAYLFLSILLGLVPVVLYFVRITNVLWAALASGGFSLVVLIGVLVFADDKTKAELKKRFHI